MKRFDLRLAVLPALLVAASGCAGREFDPYNRLNSLRVLAIKSDPVAPAPGETTTFSALLYVPKNHSEPELSWSWCPFPGSSDDGYPCEVEESSFGEFEQMMQLPPLDLGTGEMVTFENTLNPMILQMVCQGDADAPALPFCKEGLPAQIKLKVKTDKDEVIAVRKLNVRFDPEIGANNNPEIDGVEARIDGEWLTIDEDFDKKLRRDERTDLRANVTEEQAEQFESLDVEGNVETERERLTLTWFVESGNTRSERTGYIEGISPMDVLRENRWIPEPSKDYSPETAELVLVLRDSREGVAWHRVTVGLTESP
jgi:hypothetical protein